MQLISVIHVLHALKVHYLPELINIVTPAEPDPIHFNDCPCNYLAFYDLILDSYKPLQLDEQYVVKYLNVMSTGAEHVLQD